MKSMKVIDSIIQRNGYLAHQENILLATLNDEHKHIREQFIAYCSQDKRSME